jgi:Hemerythrin HHE cation binding domain
VCADPTPRRPAITNVSDTDGLADVGDHLVEVHDHLRAELARLRQLVEQLRAGSIDAGHARSSINEMTMRQNDWTVGAYCASYCRFVTQHHAIEDAGVFPHLRTAEPDLGPVLDRLAAEHIVIHDLLTALDRAFVAYVGTPGNFTVLDAALEALDDTLSGHLAYEESQLVPALSRHGFYPGQLR